MVYLLFAQLLKKTSCQWGELGESQRHLQARRNKSAEMDFLLSQIEGVVHVCGRLLSLCRRLKLSEGSWDSCLLHRFSKPVAQKSSIITNVALIHFCFASEAAVHVSNSNPSGPVD